jgi:hypothetical protein
MSKMKTSRTLKMSKKQTKVKEKDAERFFFREIFWNSASDIEMGSFYTFFEMGT